MESNPTPISWRIGPGRTLALDPFVLMGILNATPDSFSDGGAYPTNGSRLAHARRLLARGAGLIDIGGASSRPGAAPVAPEEERDRVVPVIEALAADDADYVISIDTTRAFVAEAALNAGATVVNDVSGGTEDPDLLPLVAERGCGLILMHRMRAPQDDVYSHEYAEPVILEDVVDAVAEGLAAIAARAEAAGVHRSAIVLDPGLGFGKTVAQNFVLMAAPAARLAPNHPLLGASSRKSFIGAVTGIEVPADRVAGSVAAALGQFARGVRIFRVHDVRPHWEALAIAAAIAAVAPTGRVGIHT